MLLLLALACAPDDGLTRDDLPDPAACGGLDPATWVEHVSGAATWEADQSLLVVEVALVVDGIAVANLEWTGDLTTDTGQVAGVAVSRDGLTVTAQLQPDHGDTAAELVAALACGATEAAITATLDLSGTPSIGGAIPVTLR